MCLRQGKMAVTALQYSNLPFYFLHPTTFAFSSPPAVTDPGLEEIGEDSCVFVDCDLTYSRTTIQDTSRRKLRHHEIKDVCSATPAQRRCVHTHTIGASVLFAIVGLLCSRLHSSADDETVIPNYLCFPSQYEC